MQKYMTIHTTESGDHANFFEHLSNAYEFYHDMIGMGYSVSVYQKNEQGIFCMTMCSINGKEEPDNV